MHLMSKAECQKSEQEKCKKFAKETKENIPIL